jgi:hypothetical protein
LTRKDGGPQHCAWGSGIERGRGVGAQIRFTLLDQRHQVRREHPDPWGTLRAGRGIESKHRDERSDLLQGQQGLLEQFVPDAVGGEGRTSGLGDYP